MLPIDSEVGNVDTSLLNVLSCNQNYKAGKERRFLAVGTQFGFAV